MLFNTQITGSSPKIQTLTFLEYWFYQKLNFYWACGVFLKKLSMS